MRTSLTKSKSSLLWQQLTILFAVALLFSYPWELAQAPLYVGGGKFSRMLWHCLLASLGDSLIMLFIFFLGWLAFHRRDWFKYPGVSGYAFIFIVGFVITFCVELVAINSGLWAYTPQMPKVPGVNIGIVPIIFIFILPPLIFRVAAIGFNLLLKNYPHAMDDRLRKE